MFLTATAVQQLLNEWSHITIALFILLLLKPWIRYYGTTFTVNREKWCKDGYLQECKVCLPRWFNGKESACQCRRHRFHPWSGKIPHAVEQLNWCTMTVDCLACALGPGSHNSWAHAPQLLTPVTQSLYSSAGEATTMRSPNTATQTCSLQLETSLHSNRPSTVKNKERTFKNA